MKRNTVEYIIKRFCPSALFLGLHTERKSNASDGYGFLYLADRATAERLITRSIPLRTPGGLITFKWALKKTSKQNGRDENGEAQGRGGYAGRGRGRGFYAR